MDRLTLWIIEKLQGVNASPWGHRCHPWQGLSLYSERCGPTLVFQREATNDLLIWPNGSPLNDPFCQQQEAKKGIWLPNQHQVERRGVPPVLSRPLQCNRIKGAQPRSVGRNDHLEGWTFEKWFLILFGEVLPLWLRKDTGQSREICTDWWSF